MRKRYRVTLTSAEREQLVGMRRRGRVDARVLVHAGMLLKADEGGSRSGWTDARIAEALECGTATVERVRKRFVEEGFDAALRPKPTTRTYVRKLDGKGEARLITLACSDPPSRQAGHPLHAEARVVAEYGGDRTQCPGSAMPGPADSGKEDDGETRARVDKPTEQNKDTRQLAIHHEERSYPTTETLSINRSVTEH